MVCNQPKRRAVYRLFYFVWVSSLIEQVRKPQKKLRGFWRVVLLLDEDEIVYNKNAKVINKKCSDIFFGDKDVVIYSFCGELNKNN